MTKRKNKEVYKILDVGNVYFPLLHKGEGFVVQSTVTIPVISEPLHFIRDYSKQTEILDFSFMAREIWSEILPQIEEMQIDKNSWIVLNRLEPGFKKDEYIASFDVLIPTKLNGGNDGNKNKSSR